MDKNQLSTNAAKIIELARRHGALNLRVFGSVARGDEIEDSDIDLLYTRAEKCSPWFPGGLKADLEQLLGVSVDLVSDKYIKNRFKPQIQEEAIPLCDLINQD